MTFPTTLKQTFLKYWPEPVKNLGLRTKTIELSLEDSIVLGTFSAEFCNQTSYYGSDYFSDDFLAELSETISTFKSGVMPRIGYCSWKASMLLNQAAIDLDAVLAIITKDDPRVGAAIATDVITDDPVFLHLREWCFIRPWSEFRLFIRDRKVIGVSQYHHQDTYPEIHENLAAIKASMIPFSGKLIEALHMDTVVADVFVEQKDDGSFTTTLIELNPFIWHTDPCLYSWKNGGDFDGGIRYCKSSHNSYRNTNTSGQHASQMDVFREEDYRRS